MMPRTLVALVLVAAAVAARHPNSLSSSRWEIEGTTIHLVLRCQVQSVLEVLPELDADEDRWIDEDELAAVREDLAAYLAGHYRVRLDSGGDPQAGHVLPGELVLLVGEENLAGFAPEQWIVSEWVFEAEHPVTDLMLEMTLFFETSPRHRDFASIVWSGTELPTQVLWMGAHRFHHAGVPAPPDGLDEDRADPDRAVPTASASRSGASPARPEAEAVPPRPRVDTAPARPSGPPAGASPPPAGAAAPGGVGLGDYVRMGVEHILTGWDHLAFLLALLVAARGLASLVGVVTAFTLAHSITLALAAFDVVVLPGGLVEAAIALSIVVAGLDGLLREPHTPWVAALGFGLVHGLGFAGFLRETFLAAPSKTTALLGFNLGVELGQLAFVLLVTAAILLVFRRGERDARLVPTPVAAVSSLAVTVVGAWWLLERTVLA